MPGQINKIRTVSILVTCLLFSQCARKPEVTYNIPDSFPEARRKQLIEIFEKGQVLYKANCSGCHGIFTKGKDSIPNFTNIQIDNYGAKFMNGDPLNHAVARKMSQDQLNQVLTFLRLKRVSAKDSVIAARRLR